LGYKCESRRLNKIDFFTVLSPSEDQTSLTSTCALQFNKLFEVLVKFKGIAHSEIIYSPSFVAPNPYESRTQKEKFSRTCDMLFSV